MHSLNYIIALNNLKYFRSACAMLCFMNLKLKIKLLFLTFKEIPFTSLSHLDQHFIYKILTDDKRLLKKKSLFFTCITEKLLIHQKLRI